MRRLLMHLLDLVVKKCNPEFKTKNQNSVVLLKVEEVRELQDRIMMKKKFQIFQKTGAVEHLLPRKTMMKALNLRKIVASREEKVATTSVEEKTDLLDSAEKEVTTLAEKKVASKEEVRIEDLQSSPEKVRIEDLQSSPEKVVMTSAEEKKALSSKEEEEVKEAASEAEEKEEIEETSKEEKAEASTEKEVEAEVASKEVRTVDLVEASIEEKEDHPNSAEVETEAEAAEEVLTVTMLQDLMAMMLKALDSVIHVVLLRSD